MEAAELPLEPLGEPLPCAYDLVDAPNDDMATAAVELLFERFEDGAAEPRFLELPVTLLARGSSGPSPRR